MIEQSHRGGSLGGYGAAMSIYRDVIRFDADFREHRTHKGHFVFAVAVSVRKNIRRRMRLPPADSQFNRHIADFLLHEAGDGLHFGLWSRGAGDDLRNFLLNLRRSVTPTVL